MKERRKTFMKRFFMVLFLFMMATHSWAEEGSETQALRTEEVVVTAGRLEEPAQETTSDVVVIKEQDIKKMNAQFVPDVLRQVSELSIIQSGGKGKLANVLLRGGSAEQTMVMIDGVRVKSTTTGSYDFSGLSVDDIERIEIVKGPQSTIYGSEAMAGVINIITKKGKGKPKTDFSFEGGSFGTVKPTFSVSGGDKRLDYRFTTSYFKTDGISVAKGGAERDGYRNASLSFKTGLKAGDNVEVELSGKYYHDRTELDAMGADDLNYIQRGYHYLVSGRARLYLSDKWEQVLTLSTVRDTLEYRDPDTSWNNSDIATGIDTIDWQNNLYLSNAYILTGGAEYRVEKGENIDVFNKTVVFDKSVDMRAVYLNNKLKAMSGQTGSLVFNAGLRHDNHGTAGGRSTYKVGAMYDIKPAGLRLKTSYGTGFRAPTLNELFYQDSWGSSGNPNLRPEKSTSWELGAEKDVLKATCLSLTYFNQNYKDLIQWVEVAPWTYQPRNVRESEVKGIEAGSSVDVTDNLNIKAGYTYLDTEDKATGKMLARRPKDKVNLTVRLSDKKYSLTADYVYVGGRYDLASSTKKDLPAYSVVNLSGTLNLTKALSLFARLENLFDEDYAEAKGYGTAGRAVYGGIKTVF